MSPELDGESATVKTQDLFVEAPQGKLFVRVWGGLSRVAETTIVMLHDSLGCVELWRDFPAMLSGATGLPVVAYDRLGFGKSDPHPGRLGFDFIRDEPGGGLAEIVGKLGLQRVIPFGHSVGGGMAVATGAALPEICSVVITESAQVFVEDRTTAGVKDAKAAFQAPGRIDRLARYHGDKARWVLDAWTETWLAPEFAAWSLDEDLHALRCPVLAMHGDRDEYGSLAFPERITRLASSASAEMMIFEDCGHAPHRERPEAVLQAVTAFLAKVGV